MRLLLAWSSVASVAMWLPVGVVTAVAWLVRQDLATAPPLTRHLATLWLATGSAYPAISTVAVLLAWRFHRSERDDRARWMLALPAATLATFAVLAAVVFALKQRHGL